MHNRCGEDAAMGRHPGQARVGVITLRRHALASSGLLALMALALAACGARSAIPDEIRSSDSGCTGPVGFWQGEGNMLDSEGSNDGHWGLLNNATPGSYTAGEVGKAFELNGASYVEIPDAPALDFTTGITMSAWIYANSLGGRIIDKITAYGVDGYLLDTLDGGLRMQLGAVPLSTSTSLPTTTWTHVAGTWDGDTMTVYVNGSVSTATTFASPITLPANALELRLGADSAGQVVFDGLLDQLALYDRALTQAQVHTLYTSGPNALCPVRDPSGT
jgi:hypothetical protein